MAILDKHLAKNDKACSLAKFKSIRITDETKHKVFLSTFVYCAKHRKIKGKEVILPPEIMAFKDS